MGYDSAMMNDLNILPQYTEYFHLTTATVGLNNAAIWMGSVIGAAFIQPASDRLGRRWALFYAACICLMGAAIQSAAQNIATFVIGRIFIGIGSEMAAGPGPALIAETVKPSARGPLLGLYFSFYNAGSLISAAVNLGMVEIPSTWAWRVPSILQTVPSLLCIAVLRFLPESPRWLVSKGRHDEAREVLAIIYGNNDIHHEKVHVVLNEIDVAIKHERETYPVHPWKELVASKANIRRLTILVSFGVMIQMMGNFVISYYLGAMLGQAGITSATTKLQINTILSCWAFAAAVAGSFLVDVIGRRPLAMGGVIGMFCSLYVFGGLAKVYGDGHDRGGVYGTIAVIFFFKLFHGGSFTPLSTVYSTEVVSYRIRAAGISLFRILTSSFGLLASFAMSYAMTDLGWKFYFINASWDVLFLIIIYFTWIETRRLTLEEIAVKFGDLDPQSIVFEGVSTEEDEVVKNSAVVPKSNMA
ncbi:uncharacterized protein HMPREF1541_09893 [Cyphellophora europaea CBS 101466]|uniref:Major facilitator superfamily (MFS) profile domain-containing protein n=1 Tax=Cyphellophora europaea (strain CBS 101466) TaxID=1220924 RepID=W2S8L5_CYPE1|nr:uncharacterized protein HMPREF1541_09893 [Cyphellophora europaea CBS 101466]ETN45017.1 hypothetical protein HMPREF1541_09893 [Cyphellophora europaea CBS 101466]